MENPVWHIPNLFISGQLLLWSVGWLTAATVGLWRGRADYWRTFWLVSGIWCAINSIIALAGLLGSVGELDDLRRLLWVNAGLDVLYVSTGIVLLTRSSVALRGAGLAVLIQGAFLLLFDAAHAWLLIPG